MEDETADDLYYSHWENMKNSRRLKYSNGRTHRIIYERHRRELNTTQLFNLHSNKFNMEEEKLGREILSLTNVRPSLTEYSLNKHKRWLLPEILKQTADEYESDESESNLQVYFQNNMFANGYFDNRGLDLMGRPGTKLNMRSLTMTRDKIPNGRKRARQARRDRKINGKVVDLGEYRRERKIFNNGNRDRNSGIKRRNQKFAADVNPEEPHNDIFTVSVNFLIPDLLRQKKWPQVNHGRLTFFRHNGFFNYGQRFFRSSFYWGKQVNLMKRCLKKRTRNERKIQIRDEHKNYFSEDGVKFNPVSNQYGRMPSVSMRKKFNINEFIVAKSEKSKSIKTRQSGVVEADVPNKKIFIELTPENGVSNEDIVEEISTSKEKTNGLLEFKIRVADDQKFTESIDELKVVSDMVRIVYECSPPKILIELRLLGLGAPNESSYIILTSGNMITDGEFIFQLNSGLNLSDLKESIQKELESHRFIVIEDLLESIGAQLEQQQLVETAKPNIRGGNRVSYLLGVDTSVGFGNFVQQVRAEFGSIIKYAMCEPRIEMDECPICFCEVASKGYIQLYECGHSACYSCWKTYLETRLDDFMTSHRIECLYEKCECVLDESLLLTLIPVGLVNKYFNSLARARILKSGEYRFCSTPNCDGIIGVNIEKGSSVFRCSCGASVCASCFTEAHYPASCVQAKKYRDELHAKRLVVPKIGPDDKLYESEGKNCPKCNLYYEKNGGCNVMSCPCGALFCWQCLGNIIGHPTGACQKTAPVVKYESSHFLQLVGKATFKGRLAEIMLEERVKRETFSNFSRLSKGRKLVRKLGDHSLAEEIRNSFSTAYNYLIDISILNEHLALVLSTRNRFMGGGYSFRPNLEKSLVKSLDLEDKLKHLFFNAQTWDEYQNLKDNLDMLISFKRNLIHLIDSLQID